MITVNLTAQGGINHGELTHVQLFTQLYHFWDVCWQIFHLATATRTLGINLISFECVFKQREPLNCQSRHQRSAAVTKSTNKSAICFEDISKRSAHLQGTNLLTWTKQHHHVLPRPFLALPANPILSRKFASAKLSYSESFILPDRWYFGSSPALPRSKTA